MVKMANTTINLYGTEYGVTKVNEVEYQLSDNTQVIGMVYTGQQEFIWGLPHGTLEEAYPILEEAMEACIECYLAMRGEDM